MKRVVTILLFSLIALYGYGLNDRLDASITNRLGIGANKIYIIDFFASWCHSCKKELPLISNIKSQMGSDIEVIGVDVDENIEDANRFCKLLRDKGELSFKTINDPNGIIISKFNPPGIPAIYIVKDGKIADMIIGAKSSIDKIILQKIKALR